MNVEDKIIDLLDKENPRPDLIECINILDNCMMAFREELKQILSKTENKRGEKK